MILRSVTICICLGFISAAGGLRAAEAPKFRTDADGPVTRQSGNRPKDAPAEPQWYQLVEGQFPPEGSAHAVSGELMLVDHLERRFQIRVDRNDSQDRGYWDLPLDAAMLPYGAISYRGAPAALQDIPLGTHLHGLFYLKDPNDKAPLTLGPHNNRHTPEADFRRCFRLEDDFSYQARQNRQWQIDGVDLATKKLTATLHEADGKAVGESQTFDLLTSTRVMQGPSFADLKTLQPGQKVLFNLTWVTLYGPGRITDVWLDEPSRKLAVAQQLERHHNYLREHGLPGWITAVEDEPQIVMITFFAGVDPALFDEIMLVEGQPTKPLKEHTNFSQAPKGSLAVACETLMTYDPVNDRKGGAILEAQQIAAEPGSGGVQLKLKVDMMLEGFRPKRVVRFYPGAWKVIALPHEEQFFGRE